MPPDPTVVQGSYFRDLMDQPAALSATLAGLEASPGLREMARRLRHGEFQRVVLTGMGSSYHALHPLNLELINHRVTSFMEETSELVYYKSRFFDPRTLIIAVSQSGRSAEIVRLLEVNAGRAGILAVTNTPDSPLARNAGAMVLSHAGSEFSVSCKTYVTALAALKWLGDLLCANDLETAKSEVAGAARAAEQYQCRWEDHVSSLTAKLRDVRHLFLVGRGASMAAVGTGGLVVKESDHFPTEGMSCAAFRHGPFEMLSPDTFVLVFAGDERTRSLNAGLVRDVVAQGARAELVAEDAPSGVFRLPAAPAAVRPILEILPVQMITLALAALAGREAGRFERASKITTVE
ncbi:MAG TPA: SIS domain-containing protein [Bryobacteraceae bacterium]|nr:SIS domain-containing protein [Bryobacteraceae bacterium]